MIVAILYGFAMFFMLMKMSPGTDFPKIQSISVVAPTSKFVLENKSEWKKDYDLELYYDTLNFRDESNGLSDEQSAKEKDSSLTKEYHYEATFTLKDEQHTKEVWDIWIIPQPSTIQGEMNAKGYTQKQGEDQIYILDEWDASMFYRHWHNR